MRSPPADAMCGGVLPVVHMPYLPTSQLDIDYDTLGREVDYVFDSGAQGVCLALASDLLRLTTAERLALPAQLVRMAAGRGPVFISVGAESTQQAVEYAGAASAAGASALMATPPLTRALVKHELRDYFEALLEAVELPLMVQDASAYVGKAMGVDFQVDLYHRHGDRILFKPESTPLGPTISALRAQTGEDALIFEGSGGMLLIDSHRRGVDGTIPGVEVLPGIIAVWNALEAGDEERAYSLYLPICALGNLQLQGGMDAFITVERYLLHKQGLFPHLLHRGPLGFELDEVTRQQVDQLFEQLQRALET